MFEILIFGEIFEFFGSILRIIIVLYFIRNVMMGKYGFYMCDYSFVFSVFKFDYFKKFGIIIYND